MTGCREKRKIILSSAAVVLIFAAILFCAGRLVVPKYVASGEEGNLIAEYYRSEENHDVLFVGDCEVYESFVPAVLWQASGITSYVRGSAQQLVWHSYYLLEEMLRRESPSVVVFNVLALKYGTPQNEAYNRMTLDGMKWSLSKVRAVRASMTEEETFLSYVFPLLRYHSRWSELSREDVTYFWPGSVPTLSYDGYLLQTEIVPKTSEREGSQLLDYTLPPESLSWLEKMASLCEEHGAKLLLIKAPTNSWKYWWYDEWDEQVGAFAQSHQIDYINMIPLADAIGIDWSQDTYDGGVHLNVSGAEKLSRWFGDALLARYPELEETKDEETVARWNEKYNAYERGKEEMIHEK